MNRHCVVLIVLLVALSTTFAATTEITGLIQKKYAVDAAFQIDFDQDIYWNVREKTSKRSGTLTIAPRDKFRVELGSETYVSNGEVCWQYSSPNRQVVIRALSEIDFSFHPSNLLGEFIENYSFRETTTSAGMMVLEATDTAAAAEYRSITIQAEKNGLVKKLAYTDKKKNIYTYRFRKTVFNPNPKPSLFEFEVPADANVIDRRK